MVISFRWRDAVFAGVFFGLTVLTHLGYAYFFAFWFLVWVVTHPKKQTWIRAIVVAVTSILVILPWTILMAERYGVRVFSNAFQSHRSLQIISLIQNPVNLFIEYRNNLSGLFENPWLLLLVVGGLVLLVIKRKFMLPLLFLLILFFFYEEDQYILMVSYIIVGYFISSLYRYSTSSKDIINRPLEKLVSSIVLIGLFIPFCIQSVNQLDQQYPLVNQDMLNMTRFLKNSTPPLTSYLALSTDTNQQEEWLPYLSRREPVLAGWGSEWTGTFRIQEVENGSLDECVSQQSLPCLDAWLLSIDKQPNYIVMDTSLERFSASLGQSAEWIKVYSNSGYIIWKHI